MAAKCEVLIECIQGYFDLFMLYYWRVLSFCSGHTERHDKPAGRLLSWLLEKQKRVWRPITNLKLILQDDTSHLQKAMRD